MICPKCGFDQQESDWCDRCGIIFAKFDASLDKAKEQSRREVLCSTGDIHEPYTILDVVFAIGNSIQGFLNVADPVEAYSGVLKSLKKAAVKKGGDAVINVAFNYRSGFEEGALAKKQVFEIIAFGTAVRRHGEHNSTMSQRAVDE